MKYNAFISYSHAADGRLAPALQSALEKFAKPWYKVRNLNIFRDESSLSASPHLWDNIVKALDNSDYLVYMASPTSAKSKWVNQEVEHWLENKSLSTIVIVLTDGDIPWDPSENTFLNHDQNALPPALNKAFSQEPFYIDLRTSRTAEDVSLNNPIFKKEVLKIAAHLHGKAPKDMASDEVRIHRNMIRLRNGAIAILIMMLAFSIIQTFEAKKQTRIANEQTERAMDSAEVAKKQRQIAKDSSIVAQKQRQIAKDSSVAALEQRKIAVQEKENAEEQTKIAIAEREEAVRQTKQKEIRLSEVYWSYSKNFNDAQRPLLAELYAVEAANLLPDRGYGIGYMNLSQNVSRYHLQNTKFDNWPQRDNIEFAAELVASSRIKVKGNELLEFASWPDSLNSVLGANKIESKKRIISWHEDGTVVVRDVQSFKPLFDPVKFRHEVTWASLHEDKLIVRMEDEDEDEKWTEVWDLKTGKRISRGNFYATNDFSKLILVRKSLLNSKRTLIIPGEIDEEENEKSIPIGDRPVVMAISKDLLAVVTNENPNRITIFTYGNEDTPVQIYHPDPVRQIRISLDQRYIAVYGNSDTRYLWVKPPEAKKNSSDYQYDDPGFSNGSFSNNDKEFLLWGNFGCHLVDLTTGNNQVIPSNFNISGATFSPDNKLIVTWNDGFLELWDKTNFTKRFRVPGGNAQSTVLFAPDNSYLIQASGKDVKAISVENGKDQRYHIVLSSPADILTFAKNGQYLAIIEEQGEIHLRDHNGGLLFQKKLNEPQAVDQCWFLNQDRFLLFVGKDSHLWDISNPRKTRSVLDLGSWDSGVLSDDGTKIMLWQGKNAQIWELPSGKVLARNLDHEFRIRGGCSVAGGKLFRTWDERGTIYNWWSFSGSPMGNLPSPGGFVSPTEVVNAPNGNALLYFDYDDGRRTTYVPLGHLDGDFPEEFAQLQSQALSGVTLDILTGEIKTISTGELRILRKNYMRVLKEHAMECAMPDDNLYSLLHVGWEL